MKGLLLALALLLAAGSAEAGTVRDMLGREVRVPERPGRVVSLAPSLTETVYALGAEAQLVGVTTNCDYPPEAAKKPKVGGMVTPSLEAILTLRPDLVLATTEGNREEHVLELERLGLSVYLVRPTSFATVLESVLRVGELLGREAEARKLVEEMRREVAAVAQATRPRPRPRVLYVLWGDPLIVPGRDTIMTDLIRLAGGVSVTGEEALPYPRFSLEEVVARNPEIIVLAQHGLNSVDERLQRWRHLKLLPAVRAGRIYGIDGNLLHRPGPRIVEGLRALARLFHPEVLP
ncbi:MAG: cobalamin-binding protein [Candidatus Rokubacteria bacterium]|nr:cobalamin-binding protein [Candidatus Rokubacteria bacterium]